jgi:hypothetical protein
MSTKKAPVDVVLADFHAGLSNRDPFDDLGVLVAEVERLTEYAEQKRGGQVGYFAAAMQLQAERDALVAVIADEALIRRAICDPGQFLPRGADYTEPIPSWSARAVVAALAAEVTA